jgi:hypothetical protein
VSQTIESEGEPPIFGGQEFVFAGSLLLVRVVHDPIGPLLTVKLRRNDLNALVGDHGTIRSIFSGIDTKVAASDVSETDKSGPFVLDLDLITPDFELWISVVVTPGFRMCGQVRIIECSHVKGKGFIDGGDPVSVVFILTKLEIDLWSTGVDFTQ